MDSWSPRPTPPACKPAHWKMALRQLCPGPLALKGRSLAVDNGLCISHGRRLRSSIVRPVQILVQLKKSSSSASYAIGCGRGQSWAQVGIRRRGTFTRAALDDAPKEKKESTMQETSTTSEGLCGELQETPKRKYESEFSFHQPLALTAFLSFAYVGFALSFVPPQLHGPLRIAYSVQETVFGSNTVVRFMAGLTVFLHFVETMYARHLALKVDPGNVNRWVISTAFYGIGTLRHLIAKSSGRKSD